MKKELRKFEAIKAESIADDGYKIKGYASVFGGVDSYGDTIVAGAFGKALAKGAPKMFFNHDSYAVPIGKWTECHEDQTGLWVEGELTRGLAKADEVAAALKHGTVDGLSIGFSVEWESLEYNEDTGGFIIKEIERLREVSVVTFPADNAARIEKCEGVQSVRDFEALLRDEAGFSAREAKALCARIKAVGAAEAEKQRDAARSEKLLNSISDELKAIQDFLNK